MVKYKVNLKFKENGKSLNETIANALKIELEKQTNITYSTSKIKSTNHFQDERSIN